MSSASNSTVNIVNLANLPVSQEILGGNYLILNTPLGVRIIDWANVPVIKLDASESGTFAGTLTGGNFFGLIGSFDTLSASTIISNGKVGATNAYGFYNKFSTSNGVTYSAAYVIGSPEYLDLLTTQIPAATAYAYNSLLSQVSSLNVYERYASASISVGSRTALCTFDVLPADLASNSFNSVDFTVGYTTADVMSTTPFIPAISIGTTTYNILTATLTLRQNAPASIDFTVKVSKHF